jgi:formylglycine-generating enzyme required for sulfatase activity
MTMAVSAKHLFILCVSGVVTVLVGAAPMADEEMRFVALPAGSFEMGSATGYADEAPVHRVRINTGFELSATEVTQGQFEVVMGFNPSIVKADDLPVENVSWAEAAEFCRRLGERDGRSYRLPTEAEWEYAARAGVNGAAYVWGDDPLPLRDGFPLANVADARARAGNPKLKIFEGLDDGFARTAPVGSFPANDWGLYDMAGNVWEWCSDYYDEGYYARSPQDDPRGPEQDASSGHVFRGGSWDDGPRDARVTLRGIIYPGKGDRLPNVGFRIVRLSKTSH